MGIPFFSSIRIVGGKLFINSLGSLHFKIVFKDIFSKCGNVIAEY